MQFLKRLIATLVLATYALNVLAIERVTYYHNDATGSPIAATDKNGQILWTEAYAPYGERIDKNANGEPAYTGKFEEADFGINYFGARWYDPTLGRFLATDPVHFTEANLQSFNRYAYGNNNPYKFVDPDGKFVLLLHPLFITTVAFVMGGTYLQSHPEAANAFGATIGQIGAGGKYGWNVYHANSAEGDDARAGNSGENYKEGCIYCVKGDQTSSGKDYIGSTDNMSDRQRDKSDGRDRESAEVIDTYPKGDRDARRAKEQQAINDRGGVDKLDNKRNEITPKKWSSKGITPP